MRIAMKLAFCILTLLYTTGFTAETNLFPIMPWNGPPNDPAVFKKIKECGFTVAGFVPPAALDNCQAAGLRAIVSDARVSGYDWASTVDENKAKTNVASLIAQVGSHPAVFGYICVTNLLPAGFPIWKKSLPRSGSLLPASGHTSI